MELVWKPDVHGLDVEDLDEHHRWLFDRLSGIRSACHESRVDEALQVLDEYQDALTRWFERHVLEVDLQLRDTLDGGYPWTVLRVEDRSTYLDALERASIEADIGRSARFVAVNVDRSITPDEN